MVRDVRDLGGSRRTSGTDKLGKSASARKKKPWDVQEDRISTAVRSRSSRKTRGSGRGSDKGDAHLGSLVLADAKFTGKKSFRLTIDMLRKITEEADSKGMTPAIVVEFGEMPLGCHRDWAVVPLSFLAELIEEAENGR